LGCAHAFTVTTVGCALWWPVAKVRRRAGKEAAQLTDGL